MQRAAPLPECVVIRVTRKRFRALLISDALRWERKEEHREAFPTGPETDVIVRAASMREPTRPRRVFGALDVVTVKKHWHPPQLNSDYPGRTAYSADDSSHDYEED